MEYLINTHLENYSFLHEIVLFEENSIEGTYSFKGTPFFTLIESMAQIASLHFKKTINFQQHTFLLKIKKVSPWQEKLILDGDYLLKARLKAKSQQTYFYEVISSSGHSGDFYISSIEHNLFDHSFVVS
jgi:hypothetical protein